MTNEFEEGAPFVIMPSIGNPDPEVSPALGEAPASEGSALPGKGPSGLQDFYKRMRTPVMQAFLAANAPALQDIYKVMRSPAARLRPARSGDKPAFDANAVFGTRSNWT